MVNIPFVHDAETFRACPDKQQLICQHRPEDLKRKKTAAGGGTHISKQDRNQPDSTHIPDNKKRTILLSCN